MASKDLPSHLAERLPIYCHWFSIAIYNAYVSLQKQVDDREATLTALGYTYKLDDVERCSRRISRAVHCYNRRASSFNLSGRGVWASGLLRASELTYTSQLVNALGPLVFPDPSTGCILHQMPTRKRLDTTGNPELADGYCCMMN